MVLIDVHYVYLTADLGTLENYGGSPFLSSEPNALLDNPENDDIGNPWYVICPHFFQISAIFTSVVHVL